MNSLNYETEQYINDLRKGVSNILVAVRVRPINQREQQILDFETVKVLDSKMVVLMDPGQEFSTDVLRKNRSKEINFAFDVAFDKEADQRRIYELTTQFLIDGVLEGFNATIFAYGATGAGKTYTMTGSSDQTGIIPRTLNDLFLQVQKLKQTNNIRGRDESICPNILVSVTYLEVYNETIKDLLTSEDRVLELREDGKQGQVIAGVSEVDVNSTSEIMTLLKIGNRNRAKEPTGANEESTRSHAILQVLITNENDCAKFTLVDLAGSERAAQTTNKGIQQQLYRNEGQRMIEGAKINQSLLVLGNCIKALVNQVEKNKPTFIPFRGSKLTRLLKDSLGGNCRTVMIANVSPAALCFEDTYNTLQYANRAKGIKTQATRNVLNVNNHIQNYAIIIEQLRNENEKLKRQLLIQNNIIATPSNSQKLQSLPQIEIERKDEKQIYESIEKKVQEHYKEEQKTLSMIFDTEDELDKAQIEILQQENLLSRMKNPKEKENLEEQIDHLRNKMQILEIDLSDLNLSYKDLVIKRKQIWEKCQANELENTNALILQNLLKQNQLMIENLQMRQMEKRGDFQTQQKELEIEFLQNKLKRLDEEKIDRKNSRNYKHVLSQDKMINKPLLPPIKQKQNLSPIQIPKKRYDYRDIQVEMLGKGHNHSVHEEDLSPVSGKENETSYHDYSLQNENPRNMVKKQQSSPISRTHKLNKQKSLITISQDKQKVQQKNDGIFQNMDVQELKKFRLKRLNLQIKQNKLEA